MKYSRQKIVTAFLLLESSLGLIFALQKFQYTEHFHDEKYPIKIYRGLSSNYRGQRWAYVHFIGGAANYPIIYP